MPSPSASSNRASSQYKAFVFVSVGHTLLVLLIWVGVFYNDVMLIPAWMWVTIAWLWLIWPFVLYFHPGKSNIYFVVALVLNLTLLSPCATTIYAFTTWGLEGFAP